MQPCPFFIGYLRSGYERKSVIPVTFSNNRLESGQKVSLKDGSLPRDRLSLGGQNGLALWWFVPDRSHGASSSNPLSRSKRLALSVTLAIFWHFEVIKFTISSQMVSQANELGFHRHKKDAWIDRVFFGNVKICNDTL